MSRFSCDDTIRNLFRQFGMGNVQRLFAPLIEWQMERLPVRREGYSLDLDSTVFERYGRQEGSRKNRNPRKHGRQRNNPLLAVLAEARFILNWSEPIQVSSTASFSSFLEQRCLPCTVVIRVTKWVRREAQRSLHWRELDANYAAG